MTSMSFYELASDTALPDLESLVIVQSPPLDELEGFTLEPGRVLSDGKRIVIRHKCGWCVHVEADPHVGALEVLETMQMHLLMRECREYHGRGGQ